MRLFGYYLVNVWGEEGVSFRDFGTDGPLDGGFDFAFGAGGDADWKCLAISWALDLESLLFLEHCLSVAILVSLFLSSDDY